MRNRMSLERAEQLVERSGEVMGGLPVFKGTRVPIDVVTASVQKGIPFERIHASYGFLTEELIAAALVYTLAYPERFQRTTLLDFHPNLQIVERRVVNPSN